MKVIVSGVGTGVQPSRVSFIITSTEEKKILRVFEKPNPALSLSIFQLCVLQAISVLFRQAVWALESSLSLSNEECIDFFFLLLKKKEMYLEECV